MCDEEEEENDLRIKNQMGKPVVYGEGIEVSMYMYQYQ